METRKEIIEWTKLDKEDYNTYPKNRDIIMFSISKNKYICNDIFILGDILIGECHIPKKVEPRIYPLFARKLRDRIYFEDIIEWSLIKRK